MLCTMLLMLLACTDLAGTSTGPRIDLGEGQVWSFAETDVDGAVTQLGVAFGPDALVGLPTADTELDLALPDGLDLAPFDHVGLGWLPAGHDPLGIWDEAHFDVHFFLVGPDERALIDIDDARIDDEPPAETVPVGYVLAPGSAVQGQGSHWVDLASDEWTGGDFTGSLVFGSWDATWVFLEPMIPLATLQATTAFDVDVPEPEIWQPPGRYPTRWGVAQGDGAVEVVLGDLRDE